MEGERGGGGVGGAGQIRRPVVGDGWRVVVVVVVVVQQRGRLGGLVVFPVLGRGVGRGCVVALGPHGGVGGGGGLPVVV